MGLFNKKITWQADENGVSIFAGKEDIAAKCALCWAGDDLVAYYEADNATLLLRDYEACRDNQLREAETLSRKENTFLIRSEDDSYTLITRGINRSEESAACLVEGDLWLYDQETGLTYNRNDYGKLKPDEFLPITPVSEAPDYAVFYRTGKQEFRITYQGAQWGEGATAVYSDNDIVVYVPELERQFLIEGAYRLRKGHHKEASFSLPRSEPLFKKLEGHQYHLFFEGRQISGSTPGFKSGRSVVLYLAETNSHYWVDDGWVLEPGSWQKALLFAEDCEAVWHADGQTFEIYLKGRRITKEIQLQRVGDNGVVMHEPTMTMLQIENLFTTRDNKLRGV